MELQSCTMFKCTTHKYN